MAVVRMLQNRWPARSSSGRFMSAARAAAAARRRKANRGKRTAKGRARRANAGPIHMGVAGSKSQQKWKKFHEAKKASHAKRHAPKAKKAGKKKPAKKKPSKPKAKKAKKTKSGRARGSKATGKKKAATRKPKAAKRSKTVAKKKKPAAKKGGKKKAKRTKKQLAAARKNIKKAQAAARKARKGKKGGKKRSKRGSARVSLRRRGGRVIARAHSTRKGRRVTARRRRVGRSVMVTFRSNKGRKGRGRKKNNWLLSIPGANMLPAPVQRALGMSPGVAAGLAGGYMLPALPVINQFNKGWLGVGLTFLGGVLVTAGAGRFSSQDQALGAAIGGVVATIVKAVATATSPASPVRKAVGIGLSDLGDYAGLGDFAPADVSGSVEDDDVDYAPAEADDMPAQLDMDDDMGDFVEGMDDLVSV